VATTGGRTYRNGVEYGGYTYVPCWSDDIGSGGSYTGDDKPSSYIYKADADANWTLCTINPRFFKYFAVADNKLCGGYIGEYTDRTTISIGSPQNDSQTSLATVDQTGLVAGDVVLIENELELLTNVAPNSTVVRGYRGTAAAAHAQGTVVGEINLYSHYIRTSVDGTNGGSWAGAVEIGDSSAEITALVGYGATLYIVKQDGLYSYNFTDVVEIDPSLKTLRHVDFGRGSFLFQDKIIIPKGSGGMLMYDTSTGALSDISLEHTIPGQTQYHGKVAAGCSGMDRIWLLVQDSANTRYHIMMGMQVSGSPRDFCWHHIGSISYTTGTDVNHAALMAESVPSGSTMHHRLLVGVESTGSNLLPYILPQKDDVADVYNSADDSYAIMTAWNAHFADVSKRFDAVVGTTDNLGATANDHYLEIQYRIDGGAWSWFAGTEGGTASQANSKITTGTFTKYFPSGTDGKKVELKILFYQGTTTTTTPALLDCTITAQLRPSVLKLLPLTLHVADGLELLNGTYEYNSSALLSQLRSWNAQTDEVTVTLGEPIETATYECIFLPGTYKERVLLREYGHRPEYEVSFVLAEVA